MAGTEGGSTASPVETRGIDLIPDEDRYGRPRDLTFLWAGTTTTVFTVVYGAGLVAMGLSFTQAVVAIVLGNLLAYPLLALTSLQGPTTGTTTMTISRSAFGVPGARLQGGFSWFMLVGFEAGGLILIVYAALGLLKSAGVGDSRPLQIAAILVMAAIQGVLPFFGHALMMKAQQYFSVLFAIAFAVMAVLVLPKVDLMAAPAQGGAGIGLMTVAIAFVMASGGLSWAPSGSNFSRYLPRRANPAQVGFFAALGGFVPYVLLQTLGAAAATITLEASDPISGLPGVLPKWFAVPYLLLVMISLLVQNSTNLYSSGLNLQTAGVRVSRLTMVVVDSVVCAVVAFIAVTNQSFYGLLNAFLGLIVIWLAPWVGVYLADWVLRKGRYDLRTLDGSKPAPTTVPGLVAEALGMIVSALWLNGIYEGPLAKITGGLDLSIPAGIVVAFVAFVLLARRAVGPAAADPVPDSAC